MFDRQLAEEAGANLAEVRRARPLIHNITNFVVMNYTANGLLAMGASPVMAHAQGEVEEMVSLAGALVLNIGTLSPEWIDSMVRAGKRANELDIPVVLDPVGSGATRMRTASAKRIIGEVSIRVIRGNSSEILSLAQGGARTKGVDSLHAVDEAGETAGALARELKITLAVTGAVDLVTDGSRLLRVHNGHPMMQNVTGTGCTATAAIGAFMAVDKDSVRATATALAYFGLAGEKAAEKADGPGSYQIGMLDALYRITPEHLKEGARIQR
ncbi:MAG: hydroxyethylthiazole kinase [Desulfobacteraceae bacterium]|nr:MAG: hydroxyethylthiazole kinase [Desulfobacteraceae bacterium]